VHLNSLTSRLSQKYDDPISRFVDVRSYLDGCDDKSVDSELLESFFNDDQDTVRAEAADFAIISGGISPESLLNILDNEKSDLVYPRLWLALARTSPELAKTFLSNKNITELNLFERCFFDGAEYLALNDAFYLYDLCAIVCSKDIAASHSAIDVIYIVAGHRKGLLAEVLSDLRSTDAENTDKAAAVFGIEALREPKAR
jgi:hypothetical protein